MSPQQRIVIEDDTLVGEARRLGAAMSRAAGLSEAESGKVSIVVNELGTNIRKHAGTGELYLQELAAGAARGLEVIALDKGPGMNLETSMRDGQSTAGTRGEGLGAIRRQAELFDAWSSRTGTVIAVQIWAGGKAPASPVQVGGMNTAYGGETQSGDAWDCQQLGAVTRLLVADGLGHGPIAARAAEEALRVFGRSAGAPTAEAVVHLVHAGLRSTRGAAVAVAELDLVARELRYCGVGNIAATVEASGQRSRGLMSNNGIAGHEARRVQQVAVPWPAHAVLVMHSDGITSHWKLDAYPGLLQRHPSVIAAVLHRDYRRPTDDATVVVVKEP